MNHEPTRLCNLCNPCPPTVVVAPVLRFIDVGYNANITIEVRVYRERVCARHIPYP